MDPCPNPGPSTGVCLEGAVVGGGGQVLPPTSLQHSTAQPCCYVSCQLPLVPGSGQCTRWPWELVPGGRA